MERSSDRLCCESHQAYINDSGIYLQVRPRESEIIITTNHPLVQQLILSWIVGTWLWTETAVISRAQSVNAPCAHTLMKSAGTKLVADLHTLHN